MAENFTQKLPPQNIEAEQGLLGSLMLDKNAIIKVVDLIRPEDFYRDIHRIIFEAILKLYEQREPIDMLSLTNKLQEANKLTEIGGASYLANLVNSVPTAAHVVHYAKIVQKKATLRRLIDAASQITNLGYQETEEVDKLLDHAEQKIFSVSQKYSLQNFTPLRPILEEAFDRIDELHKQSGKLRGLATGFYELDNILAGLQKSDLVILAARPSLGKTSLMLDIARHAGVKEKVPVGIFSLEMSKEQLVDRFICAQANVELWKLRTGKLSSVGENDDFTRIGQAMGVLSEAPIFIDDTAAISVLDIRTMARRLQAEHGLGLIVVDYLQLMESSGRSESRVQEISEISRSLKALSRELNIPVLAVSQLSRAVESRIDQIPRLSDLRESGCLAGDTLIMRADTGQLMKMSDLAKRVTPEPIPVFTLDKQAKIGIGQMTKVFSSGRKKVYKLKTKTGRIIKASGNHPFRKLDDWYRLDSLSVGDKIALPRQIAPLSPYDPLSCEEIILLAHLLGDGCFVPHQPIHYTSGDLANIQIVKEASEKLFNIKGRIVSQKNWYHIYLPSPYRLTRNKAHPITMWLKKLGLKLAHSWEKEIPDSIFLSSEEKIKLFLKHLWATDGNISWKYLRGRLPSASIYFSSTSIKIGYQVQHLLLRLGILSTIRISIKENYRPSYQVHIQGKTEQLKFLTQVGCFAKRGEIIPQLISTLEKIRANPNTDIIPKEAWKIFVEPAKIYTGASWRQISAGINTAYCGSTLFKTGIGRERMHRLALYLQNNILEELANSDIYWDEIIEIAPLGVEEVYDATVSGTHNFIANDIIVHNSIEQDADVVLFIYREDRVKKNPKTTNIADIIIAKHRNGPIGQVKLYFDESTVSFKNLEKRHTE